MNNRGRWRTPCRGLGHRILNDRVNFMSDAANCGGTVEAATAVPGKISNRYDRGAFERPRHGRERPGGGLTSSSDILET